MHPNNIRGIFFDLDGTLRHNIPSGGDIFTDRAISLGLHATEEDRRRAAVWEHYYFARSPEILIDQDEFKDSDEKFWSRFAYRRLVALGCPPHLLPELSPDLAAYMQANYKPDNWIPEETHTVLPALQESGFTLGLVSNRGKPYEDEIRELGLEKYFVFSLAAGQVDSWKPDPGIFKHALKQVKLKPEQTMYIGDNYFADVIGARRAGLLPVLYDPKGLFHEPGCPVITSFKELTAILN